MSRKKRNYLELHLKEQIVEGRPEQGLFSRRAKTALYDVLRILEKGAQDSDIAALAITLEDLDAGWARLSNIRRAISRFREARKPVYCYLTSGGNAEYYVATACDRIFMAPASSLHLVGLASEVFFFREVLDQLGIEPQVESVGEFKSAGEMFTRTTMSAPAREQWDALLDDYSREFCKALASGRGLPAEEMTARINSGPYSAREALRLNLVDGICYADEISEKLKEALGTGVEAVDASGYVGHEGIIRRLLTWRRPRVGVIDVLGSIAGGESRRDRTTRNVAGAETLGRFIDHARKSRRVRAVVVRIDSPGGTGLASDLLWRKISLLAKDKPVVMSFGDVAASGGYYIAAPGNLIFAEPTSVTGSIGVLGGKVVALNLISRLSVHRESVTRGDHAEFDSVFAPFSGEELERLRAHLHEFYREDFVKKVAEGRKISEEEVDSAGRGRVWSGLRAAERRLVDRIGGLDDAIAEARRLSGVPARKKVRVVHYARRRKLRDMLMPDFAPQLATAWPFSQTLEVLDIIRELANSTILLWMPFRIRIR